MFDNRELAILIWISLLFLWGLSKPKVRPQMAGVFRAALSPRILAPLFLMVVWVYFEIVLVRRFVVPSHVGLAKPTVVWFLTAGLVLFGSFAKVSREPSFFRSTALGLFAWPSLVEFYLELFTMSLVLELLLQPVAAALAIIPVLAERDKSLGKMKSCAEVSLGVVGLSMLAYVSVQVYRGWADLDGQSLAVALALPALLTLGFLPFVFLLALYAAYDDAFRRIDLRTDLRWLPRFRAKLALVFGMHIRVKNLSDGPGHLFRSIAETRSFIHGLRAVRAYRQDLQKEKRKDIDRVARLQENAGRLGVDENGRQLDRREFEQSAAALRWLSTCMMGWYKKADRYPSDLLSKIDSSFVDYGLEDPGIQVRVSDDGQRWFGWRTTITGWCFAIGAATHPPDQWEYDGPRPPEGFPGLDPLWGESAFSDSTNRNW